MPPPPPPVGDEVSWAGPNRNHHYGDCILMMIIIIIITIIIIVVVIKRMNLYRASRVAAECDCARPRSGNVDALFSAFWRKLWKISRNKQKNAHVFSSPFPIVATSQRIWTSSSTVGDAIKKSPGPHQSMGGRFYKDGRTDTVRTERKQKKNKGLKVKIALRSAIAQRTFFFFFFFYLFIFRMRFFLCLAHLFLRPGDRKKDGKNGAV